MLCSDAAAILYSWMQTRVGRRGGGGERREGAKIKSLSFLLVSARISWQTLIVHSLQFSFLSLSSFCASRGIIQNSFRLGFCQGQKIPALRANSTTEKGREKLARAWPSNLAVCEWVCVCVCVCHQQEVLFVNIKSSSFPGFCQASFSPPFASLLPFSPAFFPASLPPHRLDVLGTVMYWFADSCATAASYML